MSKTKGNIYYNVARTLMALLLLAGGLTGGGLLVSCRDGDYIIYPEDESPDANAPRTSIVGMYLLNEGNMGSNKCTIDYLDLSADDGKVHYLRNIYPSRNPSAVRELGDVGNDVKIYGQRMWIVVNCSNKVEVVTASDCRRIGQVDIPNCRNVVVDGGYAYVSSFAGPVDAGAGAQLGRIYKVDTLSMKIVGDVTVGYQPEEMAIVGSKMYVANSGGYLSPAYDFRLSVIDLPSFSEQGKVMLAKNLHRCRADKYGQLWVTSRGNYMDIAPRIFCLTADASGNITAKDSLNITVSDLSIVGDSLYFYGSQWKEETHSSTFTYGIIDIRTHKLLETKLFDAPEIAEIKMPYGIMVNPIGKDFYLMDAKNYVSSGELLHFLPDGTFDWKVKTGDIPGHAAFLYRKNATGNKGG